MNNVPDEEERAERAQDFVCVEIVKVCTSPSNTYAHYFTVNGSSEDFPKKRRDE